jgi:hypothetical protein
MWEAEERRSGVGVGGRGARRGVGERGEGEALERAAVANPGAGIPVAMAALGAAAVELADGEVRGHGLDLPLEPRQH